MTSLFAQLFLAIQERIKDKVQAIVWIDQDLGQLEHYEIRPAVSFPCLLIDFQNTQYQQEGELNQWANIAIEIRLGFAPFASANSAAPDIAKDEALKYYEIEQQVYVALHNWIPVADDETPLCQPFVRLQTATERRNDTYRVRSTIFTTATEDNNAAAPYIKRKPGLTIETGLE